MWCPLVWLPALIQWVWRLAEADWNNLHTLIHTGVFCVQNNKVWMEASVANPSLSLPM